MKADFAGRVRRAFSAMTGGSTSDNQAAAAESVSNAVGVSRETVGPVDVQPEVDKSGSAPVAQ